MKSEPAETTGVAVPQSGMVFGKYRLVRELGRGGMASVWLAAHTILGAPVAVKILAPEIAARDPRFMVRFLREARLAGRIHHPHLVAVHDVGRDPATGLSYMVMDYLPGGSVAGLLARNGPLPVANALRIVTQVAGALAQAERYGMVHRDIKPDNILFDENGEAKLSDLGIAKADLDGHAKTLTQTAAVFGTPVYMSPEQVRDTRKVDIRADIYSLGVVFYEMLSAKRPYSGGSAVTVLLAVAEGKAPPPDLAELRPNLPADTVTLVRRMMARDPEDRPRTAAALLTELRALGTASASQALGSALAATVPPPPRPDSPVSAAPTLPAGIAVTPESWSETIPMDATGVPTTPEKGRIWRRVLPWMLATVATLIAIVSMGVAWAVGRRSASQPAPSMPAPHAPAVETPPAADVQPEPTPVESQPELAAVTQEEPPAAIAHAPAVETPPAAIAHAPAIETPPAADAQPEPTPVESQPELAAVAQETPPAADAQPEPTPVESQPELAAVAQEKPPAAPLKAKTREKPRSRILLPSDLTTEELVELKRARILPKDSSSSKNIFGYANDLDPDPAHIILRSEPADDKSL